MKNKGFTLIELLAVIVVLAIIALIATPMVLRTIDESKEGSVKESANSYMSSLETNVAAKLIDGTSTVEAGSYTVSEDKVTLVGGTDTIDVKVKGSKPAKGVLCINNQGVVTKYSIEVSDYTVDYNGFTKTVTKGENSKTSLTCDIGDKYKGEWVSGNTYESGKLVAYNGSYYEYLSTPDASRLSTDPASIESGFAWTRYLPDYSLSYTEIDNQYKGSTSSLGYMYSGVNGIYYKKDTKEYVYVQYERVSSTLKKVETILENYNPYDSTTWDIK